MDLKAHKFSAEAPQRFTGRERVNKDMESWFRRAKTLAGDAAKISGNIVTETTKKTKQLVSNVSIKPNLLKTETITETHGIKSSSPTKSTSSSSNSSKDRLKFGVTDELIVFVKGFTIETFKDFRLHADEGRPSNDPAVGNVRQDLTEWQEKHAMIILSSVKEISHLRYVLCPRHMKDGQFWGIYFMLVKIYVSPYELRAVRESKLRQMAQESANPTKQAAYEVEMTEANPAKHISEQDLDAFLLGDLRSSDGEHDERHVDLDEDLIKP
ncbi:hypothetical protein AMTRI_Chr06g200130 [Amborella trichopoda]